MGNYLNWPWVFHSFSSQALFTYSVWISALLVESKNRNKKLHGNFIVRSTNCYFNECSRRIFGTLLQTAQLPFAGQSARVFFSFSLSSSSFSPPLTLFLRQGLSLSAGKANESQGSACVFLPSSGITSAHLHTWLFFVVPGAKLISSAWVSSMPFPDPPF